MESEARESDVAALLEVNRLDYRLPPSLAVANSRALKSYPALNQQQRFGDTVVFVLSSGASFIDFQNSFISFDVTFRDDASPAVANTSKRLSPHTGYLQAIRRVTVIHSSGVEIDRQNDAVGEWAQIINYYNRSRDKRRIQGSLYNLNDTALPTSPIRDTGVSYEDSQEGMFRLDWSDAVDEVNKLMNYERRPQATGGVAWRPNFAPDNATGDTGGPGALDLLTWLQKYDLSNRTTASQMQANIVSAYKEDIDVNGQVVHVCIPLTHIMSFFDSDLLSPSFLAAGLRVEVEFYPKEHFFQGVLVPIAPVPDNDTGPYYVTQDWTADQYVTIDFPRIHLESFQLNDSVTRKISQISTNNGLEWGFDAVHQASAGSSSDRVDMQVNRALSRANNVIIKTRTQDRIGNAHADSYASDSWELLGTSVLNNEIDGDMSTFQVQLGAQYIPAAPIDHTGQFLHSALKTFSQFRRSDEVGGVPLWLFKGITEVYSDDNTYVDTTRGGLAISAVPLEASSTLQQSGSAISASRTAVVNIGFLNPRTVATKSRRMDLFVVYSKVATLYLDSVVVRS